MGEPVPRASPRISRIELEARHELRAGRPRSQENLIPRHFWLERTPAIPETFPVRMKRAHPVAKNTTSLDQKRALIRILIEKNGWATSDSLPASAGIRDTTTTTRSNIIPFPSPAK